MKKSSIIFFKVVIVFIGIIALAFMLLEPHFEGRNAKTTLFQIYFNDLFLICAYSASISFFIVLHQAFKLLRFTEQHKIYSLDSVMALRTIRYSATILIAFVVVAEIYIVIFQRGKDDIAGGVFIGLLMIVLFGIITTIATMSEKSLRSSIGFLLIWKSKKILAKPKVSHGSASALPLG